MDKSRIWLVLGMISTLSIASIAWNYNRKHYLFTECLATMAARYPSWDKDLESIARGSAYGYSVCEGGIPTFGR